MNEAYVYALKILQRRDHTVADLRRKLESKFDEIPEDVIQLLIQKNFLNDRRFAENFARKRKNRAPAAIREELVGRGIAPDLADEVLSQQESPSLEQALTAKIVHLKLRAPLQSREAARLFRALLRLGFDEDAIREEINKLHEQ